MFEDDSRDSFAEPAPAPAPSAKPAARPAGIPAKFWDPAKGALRTEALLQAYLELERRVSARSGADIPDSAEKYAISARHPAVSSDPEVNKRLYEAGFTQQQAQLVYDLAFERLVPLLVAAGAESGVAASAPTERDSQIEHLCDHFGGEARWRQIAPQLAAWGRKSLPPEAFDALASSVEGVKTLHRLMSSGEPSLGRAPAPRDEGESEDQLKKMIQDPRYWKTRDPAFIAKVTSGFRRLYGEG